jgi:hypothetical protein
MLKKYCYKGYKKTAWPSQYGDRYEVVFIFNEEQTTSNEHNIRITITGPRHHGWLNCHKSTNDTKLIEGPLCGLAKQIGLIEGQDNIKVTCDNFSNLDDYSTHAVHKGESFPVEHPDRPLGFYSKKKQ